MKRAFVAGWPIGHSRSPLIHRYWLDVHALEGRYDAVEMPPEGLAGFLAELKDGRSGLVGGNLTIPHKEAAFALVDRVDMLAAELGAINTLWVENGLLHATNTDGYGFLANLDAVSPGWDATGAFPGDVESGSTFANAHKHGAGPLERSGEKRTKPKLARDEPDSVETRPIAVVLGAGGASRAVIQALRERGFSSIRVVNRTVSRAQRLADRFGGRVTAHAMGELADAMRGASLFVNTSSLGMAGGDNMPEIDFSGMAGGALVTDIVYAPLQTPILTIADTQGLKTVDGLGMLLHQAVPGFQKWFGVRPRVDARLRALIVADLKQHGHAGKPREESP